MSKSSKPVHEEYGFSEGAWRQLTDGERADVPSMKADDLANLREVAEQKAKIYQYFASKGPGRAAQPQNVPPGYCVQAVIPADVKDESARLLRHQLEVMGAKPDHTDGVIIPGLPGAEVWLLTEAAWHAKEELKRRRDNERRARQRAQQKRSVATDLDNRPLGGEARSMLQQLRGQ